MNRKLINGLLFGVLAGASQAGSAAITGETIIEFNGMNFSSYAGPANIDPVALGNCSGAGSSGCYYEDGMAVGIVQDTSNPIAHLHRIGSKTSAQLGYHSDSAGIYIRAQDSSAFSLTSLDFIAPIVEDENPDSGSNDYWEILGYSSALNVGLDTAANSGSWIVKKTIANGFEGNISFDDNALWQNISAFWIHYNGYPQTPIDGKQFGMELDNIVVNAPVPVPAAIWMFGTGLLGLASVVRRKIA